MIEPVWIAALVFGLASRTGWPEEYILHELPASRLFAYHHAALRSEGRWTVPLETFGAKPPPALDMAPLQEAEAEAWSPKW